MDKNNNENFEKDNTSVDKKLTLMDKCLMAMSGVLAAIILIYGLSVGIAISMPYSSCVTNFRVTTGTDVY